ncbi:uncharacterized protein BX664DRAFT_362064 [Halteromyces radiatus]|uniref:uncharacterized protein n=1 Tax=Halteromyces radiatus TaxID=101107 RepID=UPI00221F5DDF|nr:uncharacterized protein BX664DRAFT_362064 [Halteromyces radiatus]KAI8079932.1 hypothetical protein BX664DRAFT_362064 [Halteromyces radiatus]
MTSSHLDEKFDGTFRQLFDTIERGTEQCSTDRLQTILEEKTSQLSLGLDYFTEPSTTSRSKLIPDKPLNLDSITFTLSTDEKDIVCLFSDALQLNEQQCAILWNSFRQQHPSIVSKFFKHRQQQKQDSLSNVQSYDEMFLVFAQLYFIERLSLLQSISSLLRLCQQQDDSMQQHPYTTIAIDTVETINNKTGDDLPGRLLVQFSRLVRTSVPTTFSTPPSLVHEYTQQLLKEQKALLEIMMIYYISRSCPATTVLNIYKEFEANGFGMEQTFGHMLNATGRHLRSEVSYLCVLLSVELLQQATMIDNGLKSSPEIIISLNDVVSFLGDIKEHALPILAWVDFLQCMDTILEDNDKKDYGKVKALLRGEQIHSHDTAASSLLSSKERPKHTHSTRVSATTTRSNRVPLTEQGPELLQRYISRAFGQGAFDYIHTILSTSDLIKDDDVNKVGYLNILYELLYRFTLDVRLELLSEHAHSTIIQDFCLLLKHEPALCCRFWNGNQMQTPTTMDMDDNDEHSTSLAQLFLNPENGRYPRRFTDIIQLLTAACGDVSTSSDTSTTTMITPVKHVNDFLFPTGWPALILKLSHYLQAGDDAPNVNDVNSILQLLERFLTLAGSTLVTRLVELIEENKPFGAATGRSPFLVSILCELTTRGCAIPGCNVELLTMSIKCLTALLPFYPTDLWLFISTSCLFPRPLERDPLLAVSFSKVPTRSLGSQQAAQVTHVIESVECEIGKYSILLALLDLIGGLIKDVQRHWWTIHEKHTTATATTTNATMTMSSSNTVNSIGVDEQYKAEILSGYFHYLMAHILPYYAGWRYKSVYDRYLIGSKMMAIFIEVERFFKFDSSSTIPTDVIRTKEVSTMTKVRDALLYRFLKDEYTSQFYLSPMLDVMAQGAWMAEDLYAASRTTEARQAELLTKLTLSFVKSLLQQQEQLDGKTKVDSTSTHVGLLEKAMLNHRTGNNGKMDFLYRLTLLVRYRQQHDDDDGNLMAIPILATNIFSLLCLCVSRWMVVPNFVQYLGDTDQAQSIIKSYLAIAKDSTQPENLLTSIWQMISLLVETQPSLALLFMECGDAIMPSPKTAVKLQDQQKKGKSPSVTFALDSSSQNTTGNNGETSSNESAVRAAVELLNSWQSLSVEKPTVLSNVLRFLATFWQLAFDHYAMVQRTRSDTGLWQALEAILLNPSSLVSNNTKKNIVEQQLQLENELFNNVDLDNDDTKQVLSKVQHVLKDINKSIQQECCMHLNRTFIMRLVSFEIQLTAGSQASQGVTMAIGDMLPTGLKNLLIKLGEPSKLQWMRREFIRNHFEPSLATQIEDDACRVLEFCPCTSSESDISPLIQMVTKVGFGDDANNGQGQGRQYGTSYLYDLPLAVSRISSLYRQAVQVFREDGDNVVDGVTTMVLVTPKVQALRLVKQISFQFLSYIGFANMNWSLVDSEMMLLQSFKTLMETSSGHVSEVIWHSKTKPTLYTFINELIDQMIEDNQDATTRQKQQVHNQQQKHEHEPVEAQNSVTLTSHQQVVGLIRALVEDWISSESALLNKSSSAQTLRTEYVKSAVSLVLKLCKLLDRENYALKDNINFFSVAYRRPLLESILLCIRTVHAFTLPTPIDGELTVALAQLLQVTCASFAGVANNAITQQRQKSMTPVPDDVAEECMKDVTVVLALLGELIKSNKYGRSLLPVGVWLTTFENNDTIPMLLKLAYHGMVLVVDEMESQTKFDTSSLYNIMVSPYAENAMYFMVALANIPEAAFALKNHGVMDLLCNNALSRRLEQGSLDIFVRFGDKVVSGRKNNNNTPQDTISGGTTATDLGVGGSGFVERNPLHILWCQMLNVVSNIIRLVGKEDDGVLRHGVLFIQKYSGQVDRSFAIANGANDSLLGLVPSESISSPLMTEIEWLTTILFGLAKQLDRVAGYAVNIFMAFKNCGLPLVKRYLYHFTHPNHMQAQLFPVDQDEKYQSQTFIDLENQRSVSFQSSQQQTNSEQHTSQLMYSTTQRAIRIARNILGSIVLLTEAKSILIKSNNEWPFGNTILSPDTRTSTSSISFGVMKEWIVTCLQLTQKTASWIKNQQQQLRDISSMPISTLSSAIPSSSSSITASSSSSPLPPSTSFSQPSVTDLKALLRTLEFSIVLLTTQTVLWIAKPDIHQDERKMIASDNLKSLVNLLDKTNTTLKQLEGTMTEMKNELELLETQVIDPLKYYLIITYFV